MSRVFVRPCADSQVSVKREPERHLVRAVQPVRSVVLAGVRGRPGERGDPGDTTFRRIRGETLSALTVVYELDGRVYALSPDDEDHIDLLLGVTLDAGDVDAETEVRRMGALDDASWSWVPGRVWLGPGGSLTQTPPADGFDVLLGAAVSATRVVLNIQDSIELE